MAAIPQEIILEILKRLPAKSLCRFKCVSKDWLSAISDPHFIGLHYDHSKSNPRLLFIGPDHPAREEHSARFPSNDCLRSVCSSRSSRSLDDKQLTATYHGLYLNSNCHQICISRPVQGLLLVDSLDKEFIIFNPTTGETLKFKTPWATASHDVNILYFTTILLGFDPVEKKYKILNSRAAEGSAVTVHYVYTLGEKTWRKINDGPAHWVFCRQHCCIDGVIYYAAVARAFRAPEHFLMAFDVRSESFQRIRLPEGIIDLNNLNECLHEFGGRLSLLTTGDSSKSRIGAEVEVWVLEDGRRSVWSLVKLIGVPWYLDWDRVRGMSTDRIPTGEIIFTPLFRDLLKKPFRLHYYDLEDGSLRSIEFEDLQVCRRIYGPDIEVLSYVENIQSLRDLMGSNLEGIVPLIKI